MSKISFAEYLAEMDVQMIESVNDKGRLKCIFILGMPGAGKSYTAANIGGAVQPRMVNTDRATNFLAGKHGSASDTTIWQKFIRTSSKTITAESLTHYINGMLPLMADGTTATPGAILRRKKMLEGLGYDCGMIYIKSSLEDAIARVTSREESGKEKRVVDREFIAKVAASADKAAADLKSHFDYYKEVVSSGIGVTDSDISKLSGAMDSFYNAPLKNPIGVKNIEKVEAAGEKYLVPTVHSKEELSGLVSAAWY